MTAACATIHADGVEWPLATFLDAYRFTRVRPGEQPRFADPGAVRLVTVSDAGEVQPATYADQVA